MPCGERDHLVSKLVDAGTFAVRLADANGVDADKPMRRWYPSKNA